MITHAGHDPPEADMNLYKWKMNKHEYEDITHKKPPRQSFHLNLSWSPPPPPPPAARATVEERERDPGEIHAPMRPRVVLLLALMAVTGACFDCASAGTTSPYNRPEPRPDVFVANSKNGDSASPQQVRRNDAPLSTFKGGLFIFTVFSPFLLALSLSLSLAVFVWWFGASLGCWFCLISGD